MNELRTCPICGKKFITSEMHLYRINGSHGRAVCSYHCMRKANKKDIEREKRRKAQIEKELRGER